MSFRRLPDSKLLFKAKNIRFSWVSRNEIYFQDEVEEIPAQPMPFCTICFGTCRYNYKGREEFLLSCAECGTSFHPACIKMAPEKALRCMDYAWQCLECKTCRECGELITGDSPPAGGACCEYCDRGVHFKCVKDQKISKKSKFINCPEHRELRKKGRRPGARKGVSGLVEKSSVDSPFLIGDRRRSISGSKETGGLVDAMSRYFTPSPEGRRTRTAQVRILTEFNSRKFEIFSVNF